MDAVLSALEKAAKKGLMPPGASILLAVSGGADSLALLYGAAETVWAGWRLSVGHVHHGWREREADRDLAFVRDHSRRLGLPFFFHRRDTRAEARVLKLSPEAAARHARYASLAAMAREAGASLIATAHQLDDRIESHFLARERRAGLAGLAGPREKRNDGVVRPFLEVGRRQIVEFLETRGLSHRRDATNGNLHLPRNRVRRDLARGTGETGDKGAGEALESLRALSLKRDRLDDDFAARVLPRIHRGPAAVLADAAFLSSCSSLLQRRAIEEAALPFAREGRSPMTGREREQILQRLASGVDFRFEAGRRIRFERRGRILRVSARSNNSPGRSVMLDAALEKESLG